MTPMQPRHEQPTFTESDIRDIRGLMEDWTGIKMGESKKNLIVSRLSNYIRGRGFQDFRSYIELLNSSGEEEKQTLINILTTNETYFFREEKLLEVFRGILTKNKEASVRIWSAACSSGEEVYTIAMICHETLPHDRWHILGTDINEEMLTIAGKGIYSDKRLDHVPESYMKKYFLKGINENSGSVAIVPKLKNHISLKKHNLQAPLGNEEKFDYIFLRNVLIYFNKSGKKVIIGNILNYLKHGGFLFVGLAESLSGLDPRLKRIAPSVYKYERS